MIVGSCHSNQYLVFKRYGYICILWQDGIADTFTEVDVALGGDEVRKQLR